MSWRDAVHPLLECDASLDERSRNPAPSARSVNNQNVRNAGGTAVSSPIGYKGRKSSKYRGRLGACVWNSRGGGLLHPCGQPGARSVVGQPRAQPVRLSKKADFIEILGDLHRSVCPVFLSRTVA